jgi:hypothetical protein
VGNYFFGAATPYASMGETEKGADLFEKLRVIVCKLRLHSRFNIKKFLRVDCEQGCATRGVIAVLVVLERGPG